MTSTSEQGAQISGVAVGAGAGLLAVPAARGPSCPFAPPPAYEQARRSEPLGRVRLWDGSTAWLVTRHADVRAVLGDRRFSADARKAGYPFLSAANKALMMSDHSFVRMDDPEHARQRRMLTGDFMVKRIEALRPRILAVTQDLLDRMTTGRDEADLVAEFALPLPSAVICLVLGVPYDDHEYFEATSNTALSPESTAEQVNTAWQDLLGYIALLAKQKAGHPDDGIISRLVDRGELTADQIGQICVLLLVAGHETTANMTALSVLALLRHPEQLARLRADPSLMNTAVEELLRYLTILQIGVRRVALEDVEIGGRTIRAGEGALIMINTANRDEEVFPDGGELDLGRENARHHVALGFGVHQCLGQPLARAELQIALDSILRRLPGLRLAVPFEQIRFKHDASVFGVRELPVAW